jgi:hypothetical protein
MRTSRDRMTVGLLRNFPLADASIFSDWGLEEWLSERLLSVPVL